MSSSIPPSGSVSKLAFPGAVLVGKYKLEEMIGCGGMGSVWSATHLGLNQQIAIKLVSSNFARSTDALRRFDNEAKAAAQIKSRHVPQVFDNGVLDDGTPYLAMELLHGETLFARVLRTGPVPLPETVNILEQCCRALGRAHGLGIVHRDIKPENIYLAHSVDDDDYVVKVLDFGIAKMAASALGEGAQSATRTGALLGTPMYMSPEQARGLRTIDHRTDLYSLGLVGYMLLTAQVAFGGETLGELLLQICTQPLPSLLGRANWLPPAMESWFQRVCAREPDQRVPSAQAFVESLRIAAGISSGPDRPGSHLPPVPFHGYAPGSPPQPQGTPDPRAPSATPDPFKRSAGAPAGFTPSTTSGTAVEAGTELSPGLPSGRGKWIVAAVLSAVGLSLIAMLIVLQMRPSAVSRSAPASSSSSEQAGVVALPALSAISPSPSASSVDPSTPDSGSASPSSDPAASAPPGKPATPLAGPPHTSPGNATPTSTPKPQSPPTTNKPGTVDLGY